MKTALLQFLVTIGELIRDLGSIPSGTLYVQLQSMPGMGSMTLHQYRHLLDLMVSAGLITEKNHLLTWVGPVHPREEPTGEGRF
ncbi:MAG: hypothetical protein ACHQX3_01015 [Nitrospirales bacterium]